MRQKIIMKVYSQKIIKTELKKGIFKLEYVLCMDIYFIKVFAPEDVIFR